MDVSIFMATEESKESPFVNGHYISEATEEISSVAYLP